MGERHKQHSQAGAITAAQGQALGSLCRSLSTGHSLPALLAQIAHSAAQATSARACSLQLLDESGAWRKPVVAPGPGLSGRLSMQELGLSPWDQQALPGQVVMVADASDSRWPGEAAGFATLLIAGLARGDTGLGVIRLYFSSARERPAADREFLAALANLTALIIDDFSAHELSVRRCADLAVLNRVAEEINQSLSLSEVLGRAVKHTAELIGVKASSIRLYHQQTQSLELAAAWGLSDAYLQKGPVEVARSAIDREALAGQIVAIADVGADPRWEYPQEAQREGIASVLAAPMITDHKSVGVLRIYTAERHVFLDEEKELLQAIARHAAVAIENARLYELALQGHDQLVQEVWQGLADVWGTVRGTP